MAKIIAALDLGTNTFHLLVGEVSDSSFKPIHHEQVHVKLGEGGISAGYITPEAFKRGIRAMHHFAAAIALHKVEKTRAVGTSALRSAKNGSEFIEAVQQQTGICIEVIDGDTEAELIYLGARNAVEISSNALVMDIGGGSVEFILCNKNSIFWKKSYAIGAARLMAEFHHNDPITSGEIAAINKHLDLQLDELKQQVREIKPQVLIGTAGAFETFAELIVSKFALDKKLLQAKNFNFDLSQLNAILQEIRASTFEQRSANPDILPVRVNMIVVSSILTKYIVDELKISEMQLSTFALKEGLVFSGL